MKYPDVPLNPHSKYVSFFEAQKIDFNYIWDLMRYRYERDFIFLRKLGIRT